MSFIAGAIIGSSIISGGIALISGGKAASATKDAAALAAEATLESTRLQVDEIARQFKNRPGRVSGVSRYGGMLVISHRHIRIGIGDSHRHRVGYFNLEYSIAPLAELVKHRTAGKLTELA